jgi:hypothetical protein
MKMHHKEYISGEQYYKETYGNKWNRRQWIGYFLSYGI